MLLELDFTRGASEQGLIPSASSTAKVIPYVAVLGIVKAIRSGSLYTAADFLHHGETSLFVFLFLASLVSSLVFLGIHRPWVAEKQPLQRKHIIRIVLNGAMMAAAMLLWSVGLQLVGTVRTIAFEFAEVVIIYIVARVMNWKNLSIPKGKGVALIAVAFVILCLAQPAAVHHHAVGGATSHSGNPSVPVPSTRDSEVQNKFRPEGGDVDVKQQDKVDGKIEQLVTTVRYSHWVGGGLALMAAAAINVFRKQLARRVSGEVGGSKKVHSISSLAATAILFPFALIQTFRGGLVTSEGMRGIAIEGLLVPLFVTVAPFYADHAAVRKIPRHIAATVGLVASLVIAVVFDIVHAERVIASFPGAIGCALLVGGVWIATQQSASVNLDNDVEDPLFRRGATPLSPNFGGVSAFYRHIMESPKSRNIFVFLCINLMYMFVELVYGYWTNSLGLMSDAGHMFFDCFALAIGLYAAVMAKWKPHGQFSYGYSRYEVLSGFINAIFLVVIGFFVFVEAIHRLFSPPELHSERLIMVSFLGLAVNLVGMFCFHEAHESAHGHSHSHGEEEHAHGHDHAHEHEHDDVEAGHKHDHDHGHDHSHEHKHGEKCDHDHDHDHDHHDHHDHAGHSHDHEHQHDASCTHDHSDHAHGEKKDKKKKKKAPAHHHHDHNMEGIFLHVLADTLGSVGVLTSSLLVHFFGWTMADSICSLAIAILIVASVIPLLTQSASTLLQRAPAGHEAMIQDALESVSTISGVKRVSNVHVWALKQGKHVATINLLVEPQANEQHILKKATKYLKAAEIENVTAQIEKDIDLVAMSGIFGFQGQS